MSVHVRESAIISCDKCNSLERQIHAFQAEVTELRQILDAGFDSKKKELAFQAGLDEKVMLLRQAEVIYRNHRLRMHGATWSG